METLKLFFHSLLNVIQSGTPTGIIYLITLVTLLGLVIYLVIKVVLKQDKKNKRRIK